MVNQFDEIDTDALDEGQDSQAMRFISVVVVGVAVVGFFLLAWYAYHAGMEQAGSASVDVIKADNSPIKEAPAEPGGQQFPHQDKTVYNLVSGKEESKAAERIMPPPEEPVNRNETETWMNKKLYPDAGGTASASATSESAPAAPAADTAPSTPGEAAAKPSETPPAPAATEEKPAPTPPAEIFRPHATALKQAEKSAPAAVAAKTAAEPSLKPVQVAAQPKKTAAKPAEDEEESPPKPRISLLRKPSPSLNPNRK